MRLGPADDATLVTAAQLRHVSEQLTQAGHWQPGDPEILIVMDAGYDVAYLTFALDDLPVVLAGCEWAMHRCTTTLARANHWPAVRVACPMPQRAHRLAPASPGADGTEPAEGDSPGVLHAPEPRVRVLVRVRTWLRPAVCGR
ncbi:hypothetical protein GCM10010521_61180 [Streptomyces rameus]|uniref:Transposase IS701-like DDE domain-containing protein n=1 Tax=Streptomyces rameus TaxID=68261 RepID=A0ABN3V196_9ACTN